VVNAGHVNPEVAAAAKAQIDKVVHSGAYVYHSIPVADLAEKLAEVTLEGSRRPSSATAAPKLWKAQCA